MTAVRYTPYFFTQARYLSFCSLEVIPILAQYRPINAVVLFRKSIPIILAYVWVSGLWFGIFTSVNAVDFSLRHIALPEAVSLVGLLYVNILPVLLTVYASLFRPHWVFLICFSRAFLFSFVSMSIFRTYGEGGWLLRYLFLFSDLVTMPIFYWIWLKGCTGSVFLSKYLTAFFFFCLLISVSEHCIIAPLIGRLINL